MSSDMKNKVSKSIAKAWLDPIFRSGLLANPKGTLEGEGMSFAPGVSVRAEEGTFSWKIDPVSTYSSDAIITIPVPPRPVDVTTAELEEWVKGDGTRPTLLPASS
jgi:hypothetical protein